MSIQLAPGKPDNYKTEKTEKEEEKRKEIELENNNKEWNKLS